MFKAFMNRLEKSLRCPIAYVRGDEKRFSGCGKPAVPRHYHVLLAAAVRLDPTYVGDAWMRMAGFRANGGGANVRAYDPSGNAIAYTLKFIFQPGGDWDSRNLDLYLLSPAAEMNRRIRRRMSRQAQRMLEASQSAPLPVCDKSAADTLAHLRRLPIESRTPEVDLDPTCGVDQEATACEIDLAREAGSAGTTNALPRRVSSDEEKVRDCERVSYGESFPQLRPLSGRGEEINMKLGEKMPLHASAQRKEQENLAEQAIELDQQIKAAVKVARRSLTDVGRLLARMKESRLWEHLPGHYRGWEDYVRSVLGSGAHSSLYETVAAFSLTEGSNPIPPEVVNRLGIKKAAQLARLQPEDRTPATICAATTQTVMAVRNRVQAKLNETACSDEQKPMLQLLSINLPKEYVDEFEELMELMVFMYGLRDGDKTQTLRHKAFQAMLQGAREYWAVELSEALQLRKAQEGLGDSPAASAQEDFPEEEKENEFPDDEQAQGRLYDEGTSTGSTD